MVPRILDAGQQGRHRCKEHAFGLSGRRQEWNDLRGKHWNICITTCKTDDQCEFNAWSRTPKTRALGQPRGIGRRRRWHPLQCSPLENPMDGAAWWATVHGVAKSQTGLSDFPFSFHFHALEEEMATHSSVLAWRIPGMGEPGGLLSTGSHRVGHDWSDLAAAAAAG